jgi:CRP/FNR family transcriptional regulator
VFRIFVGEPLQNSYGIALQHFAVCIDSLGLENSISSKLLNTAICCATKKDSISDLLISCQFIESDLIMLLTMPVIQSTSDSTDASYAALPVSAVHQHKLWSNSADIGKFLNISLPENQLTDRHHFQHLTFKHGQRVFRLGQQFDAIYFVYSGFLKTVMFDEFGGEQVLNFPMRGDVLGLESMHSDQYKFEVVALSDCNVIMIPYKNFLELSHKYEQVEQSMYEMISKELAYQHVRLAMLGKVSAEARVCQFLVMLSNRFLELGYSRCEYLLRMTRHEIGNYLGITLETVSRILSSLNESGIVKVHQKSICINDIEALKNLSLTSKTVCSS